MAGAVKPVPVGLLEELARGAPKAEVRPTNGRHGSADRLDIEGWMQRFGIGSVQCKPWQGGRLWILEACPFDPAHTDRSAYIIQHASGAVDFGCHHASCQQHDWHSLRQLKEPVRERREAVPTNGVHQPVVPRAALITSERRPINETDMGNGLRFARLHAARARYSLAHGWLVYDGKRWSPDPLGAQELAKAVVRSLYLESAESAMPADRKRLASWAVKCEENARIQAMLIQARSEPGIKIEGHDLDQQPYLFNCDNGTIDFESGRLRPHDPADLITHLSTIPYDETAAAPLYSQFMLEIMRGRAGVIDYLQTWLGHCLTGSLQAQEILFFHGVGANGKNTLIDLVALAMGDYADVAPNDWLMERKHEVHTQEVVRLMGKRLVIADEAAQGGRFSEARLKKITSGSPLKGHLMGQNDITFLPEFKVVLLANHKPIIRGTDPGIWRRIPLVPFEARFYELDEEGTPKKDPTLPDRLRGEVAGVLRWLVDGCFRWMQSSRVVQRPAEVRHATEKYRAEMDTLGEYIADRCDVGAEFSEGATILHVDYQRWVGNAPSLNTILFAAALEERGFTKTHTRNGNRYHGIRLREADDDPGAGAERWR